MKKAFSLIEILQTVILIGIIAGLSVSFFKKLNTNEKLYNATVTMLNEAYIEAGRRICSDETLICEDRTDVDCPNGGALNEVTGQCEYNVAADVDCVAGYTRETRTDAEDNNIKICVRTTCENGSRIVPAWTVRCENAQPQYIGLGGTTELCKQLHEIINHKPQVDNAVNGDLFNTCARPIACLINLNDGDNDNDDVDAIGNACREAFAANNNLDIRPSMILPNGVRLYNLNGRFVNNTLKILIKYDRNDDLTTMSARNTQIYKFDLP